MVRIWVPYTEFSADLEALGADVDIFSGAGAPPASASEVEFLVAPYMAPSTLTVTAGMPRLRIVQTLTAGYEDVLPYLPAGVTLCNARGVHDASTAELALTLILASLRGVPDYVHAQDHGKWAHGPRPALADKSVLIVGYGSIGASIERRLVPFETKVTRVGREPRPSESVLGADDLPDLLPLADIVVIITPLTQRTKHLVDADFLARMRSGALLVNVSRGAVVDTDALVAALNTGRLFAALDVTDPEPLPPDHPLWRAPGVLITPHVGGNSSAFMPRASHLVNQQVFRFVSGLPVENVVAGAPSARRAPQDAESLSPGSRPKGHDQRGTTGA